MKVKNLLVFLMSAALSSVSVDVLASVEVDGICYNILSEVGKQWKWLKIRQVIRVTL